MKLYKYMKKKYLEQFLQEGNVLFRELAFFKSMENELNIRADKYEGEKYYKPEGSVYVKIKELEGELIAEGEMLGAKIGHTYEKDWGVFLYCLSQSLSIELFEQFAKDDGVPAEEYVVVEFLDSEHIHTRLKHKLQVLGLGQSLHCGKIEYFDKLDSNVLDISTDTKPTWFYKADEYQWQDEYRYVFCIKQDNEAHKQTFECALNGMKLYGNLTVIVVQVGVLETSQVKIYDYAMLQKLQQTDCVTPL